MVNNLPAIQEIQVRSLGRENPLEKGLATQYSSILIWRIPWTEKPGGLQSVGHDWVTNTHTHTHTHTHKHRSPRWGKGCKGFGMALRIPDSLTFCFSLLVSWYTHYVHNTHTHTHTHTSLQDFILSLSSLVSIWTQISTSTSADVREFTLERRLVLLWPRVTRQRLTHHSGTGRSQAGVSLPNSWVIQPPHLDIWMLPVHLLDGHVGTCSHLISVLLCSCCPV